MILRNIFSDGQRIALVQTLLEFEDIRLSSERIKNLLKEGINKDSSFDEVDLVVIRNVINTLYFIEGLDTENISIDTKFYIRLNELLAYEQALDTGYFRDRDISIACIAEPIKPARTDEIEKCLEAIKQVNTSDFKEVIAENFLRLIRMQPFFDGNKRTTLCLCNLALLKKGLGMFVIESDKYENFENELTRFYTDDTSCRCREFLMNECIGERLIS